LFDGSMGFELAALRAASSTTRTRPRNVLCIIAERGEFSWYEELMAGVHRNSVLFVLCFLEEVFFGDVWGERLYLTEIDP
jgi:hypothetical protein